MSGSIAMTSGRPVRTAANPPANPPSRPARNPPADPTVMQAASPGQREPYPLYCAELQHGEEGDGQATHQTPTECAGHVRAGAEQPPSEQPAADSGYQPDPPEAGICSP
jgi:hypothetical protein